MHLLGADSVGVSVGTRTLLDSVSLGLDDGVRVGVVGPNGAGKSTLLRLLAGVQPPGTGRVTRSGGLRVGLLDQRDEVPPGTVADAVHGGQAVHEWARDPRVRAVHAGLLADVDLDASVASLSGGQRRRVALAAMLVRDDDVLALDEPTNHLDVEGVAWLADHLRERFSRGTGALVVVTHDRWFLDAVCTRLWDVHDATVDTYDGGYAAYVLARAERVHAASVAEDRRRGLLRKELAWLRRGAPARTAKPRFRLDAAAALIADEPPPRDRMELTRLATARLGKDVVELDDVTLRFADAPVLDHVTWGLGPGDRIGVVGANGAGKTTLLGLLSGRLAPTEGRVRRGLTVRSAELSQDVAELDELAGSTAVQVVEQDRRRVVVGGRELTAAQLVERLGFTRERAWAPVRELSGGERRRLQLLRLLVGEPNVLLLDEPTNDLDTDTLAAVEDLLDDWPGTLVVVSHDRYLLERVCDRQVALLGDGKVRDLPGGVDEFLALRRAADGHPDGHPGPEAGAGRIGAPQDAGMAGAPALPAGAPRATPAQVRAARKEAQRVERRLHRVAGEVAELHAQLAARATEPEAVVRLDARLRALLAEQAELEDAWLAAATLL